MKGIAEEQKPPAFGSTSFAGPEAHRSALPSHWISIETSR
ncbi:hypothetical protein AGRO_5261 [Agrobacterium sp. ATCC 31749]|nr:hypothetical protein AGRO_5261 [Agrobacterium sp. ATCC 31749]